MSHRAELVEVIRQIRNRWRLRLALRGVVVVVAGSVLALLLSASGLEALKFSPSAIIAFRIVVAIVFIALASLWLYRPLKRRVTDAQVALYLEEQDPTLEASILSAVEASSDEAVAADAHSPVLVDRLVRQAVEQCQAVQYHRTIEKQGVRRLALTLAGVAIVATLIVVLGPAFLRSGLTALLIVYRSAEASTPYRIEVTPGNATVPRGSDQQVKAKLLGFTAADAEVRMRAAPDGAFERVPLVPSADPLVFEGMLFHLEKTIDYYVVSNGVQSPIYTMTLVDLPTVAKLELEYRFPAYTGLPPQKIDNGGDVAALRGTEVALRVVPTMSTPGGRILLNDSDSKPLTRQGDGSLTGSFVIDGQGFYRIELEGPHGEKVAASPQYTDRRDDGSLADGVVHQAGPRHDADPGRRTVRRGPCGRRLRRQAARARLLGQRGQRKDGQAVRRRKAARRGLRRPHHLSRGARAQTGRFVSYYARANDTDAVQGGKTTTSDIYFVQIRPFRKDFKPAQSQAQMGGGGGGGNDVGQLSQQQKEIVAATFNVVRDKAKISAEKYRENVVFLTLSQGKLRSQVDELIEKMKSRQVDQDERFKKIADLLPKASPEMGSAEGDLRKQDPKAAMSPEQTALKLLQAAEQEYEMQVAMQHGGGGGGGQQASANDLADLFELELDKLANQYEMQKRAGAAVGAEDRRAGRKAEGSRATPAAGGGAAASHGCRQSERRRRRCKSAGPGRRSRRGRAASRTAHARHAPAGLERSGPPTSAGSRCHAARGGERLA